MTAKDLTIIPPKDLHVLEYGRHILEETLGWPAKGNHEMMADCLTALCKSRTLSPYQAFVYMNRAIFLAKQQGQEVDRFWFQEGRYTNVRPESKTALPTYKRLDKKAIEAEQAEPEWLELSNKVRAKLREIAFGKRMEPGTTEQGGK